MWELIWWDTLKHKIKKKFILIGIAHKKNKINKQERLEKEILQTQNQTPIDQNKIKSLDLEFKNIEEERLKGAKIRSRALTLTMMDKPSEYMFSLEKSRVECQSITKITDKQGILKENKTEVIKTITEFYSELYTTARPNNDQIRKTTNNLKNRRIDEVKRDSCEGLIERKELKQALKQLNNNKSPGNDGLPK